MAHLRRIAALLTFVLFAACGATAPPAPPAAAPEPVASEDPSKPSRPDRDKGADDDPFAPPSAADPGSNAPQPALQKLPPPKKPKTKGLEPVDLSLVVADVKGTLYVGAYAWASDGCGSLIATSRGYHIRVAGMHYASGNFVCTTALVAHWEAVPVGYGDTVIAVDNRGKRGFYKVHQETKRVTIRFLRGRDVAPPASDEGWWRVPSDILIAHVWYGKPEAVKRVSDRVHERLLDEGSMVFDTPEGNAIPTESSARYAPEEGSGLAEGYTEDLDPRSRTRIYLSTLGRRRLQRIAHEEAQRERCTYIVFHHDPYEAGGIFGRPPCDRD